MPKFIADLHIHSSYSRATGKTADLFHYAHSAGIKGVDLLSTSDFTHPAWFKAINDNLVESEPGIFRFKDTSATEIKNLADIRFMLTTEISSIYKKNDKVRKIHSLVFAPNLETAARINKKLAGIGNIQSDGRPILGLDVKHLLEIVLECSEDAFLVPAHIWTPWFSILGDKSGFDSIEEAFEELTPHIFALETGLSSDPAMNWRLSMLDRYTLISNSDAHSPAKLAREANLFHTEMNYYSIKEALKTRKGFEGTIEFFPEEGKYHYDGHRNCGIRLNPEETFKLGNDLCPVCGKKLTIGVMHRVEELADREKPLQPPDAPGFISLIPLPEVLSELTGSGETSQSVQSLYHKIIQKFHTEMSFLLEAPSEDIQREFGEVLSEAVKRMRRGEVKTQAGYDGEFGRIFLFDEGELDSFSSQKFLFERKTKKRSSDKGKTFKIEKRIKNVLELEKGNVYSEQQENIIRQPGSMRIISGPGTGKTHTLIGRIKALADKGISCSEILVLTFTHKTRVELIKRLQAVFHSANTGISIHTFHSLGYSILQNSRVLGKIIGERQQSVILSGLTGKPEKECRKISQAISRYRQTGKMPDGYAIEKPDLLLRQYIDYKLKHNLTDIDDLVILPTAFLNQQQAKIPYQYVFVDEFQDINFAQYEFCKPLFTAAKEIVVIGDPDQAIYRFRGSEPAFFDKILTDHPDMRTLHLSASFRCPREILQSAIHVIENNASRISYPLVSGIAEKGNVYYYPAANEKDEAGFIVKTVKTLVGAFELTGEESKDDTVVSFSDIAILARTRWIFQEIEKALTDAGIPYHQGEKREWESDAAKRLYQDVITLSASEWHQKILPDKSFSEKQLLENIIPIIKHYENTVNSLVMEDWEKEILIYSAAQSGTLSAFIAGIETALKDYSGYAHAEKISLLTLHAAKGLEFPVVFIPGCDDSILPYRLKGDEYCDIEEERRLFYVGLTRSSRSIYLTGSGRRFIFGREMNLKNSQFISEMKIKISEAGGATKRVKTRISQMELFG